MRRALNGAGFVACAGLLGYALYAQFQLGLDPCPLCIFQRVGIALAGVLFLIATLHNPKRWGARVYGVLLLLAVLATAAVSIRHIWIQHQPEGTIASCGAPLMYMLDSQPFLAVIRKVLTGSGECARVSWTFLGLSMPTWVLLSAAALGALALRANFSRRA